MWLIFLLGHHLFLNKRALSPHIIWYPLLLSYWTLVAYHEQYLGLTLFQSLPWYLWLSHCARMHFLLPEAYQLNRMEPLELHGQIGCGYEVRITVYCWYVVRVIELLLDPP